jgi:hypothetical protein
VPIDPSIALGVKTPEPFAALQQPIQTAATLQGLRQNQTRLNANQAISEAYRQSVDPNTGEVDFGRLQSLASQNGAGAFLPEFMGQIAQQRNSQLQYDTGKLEQAYKQQQGVRGVVGSMALDPNLGKMDMSQNIAQQIVGMVQSGLLPQDMAIRELKGIPGDPSQQKAWVTNHLLNSLSGEAKIQAMMPKVVTADTGQGTAFLNQNPLTGEMTPNTFVGKGMTQSELATPKTITMPDGSQRQVTTQQWLQMMNGGAPAGAPGAQPSPSGADYTGRYPPGGSAGAAPGTLSSLSPAQQSALSAQGGSSNTAAQDLHNAAADVPMRLNLLQQARDSLNGIQTGPGTDWRNTAKSFFNALSPDLAKKAGWTGDVQNYDEFKKILTNYASSVSGSLGSGTDARLNAAITGNANPNISKLANEDILAKTMAAEKMRAAQDYAFQNSGLTTDKFNQWQSQWNKAVDPQAFVFTSMSPAQKEDFIDRQKKAGTFAKFKANLGNLVRNQLIQMPGQ